MGGSRTAPPPPPSVTFCDRVKRSPSKTEEGRNFYFNDTDSGVTDSRREGESNLSLHSRSISVKPLDQNVK